MLVCTPTKKSELCTRTVDLNREDKHSQMREKCELCTRTVDSNREDNTQLREKCELCTRTVDLNRETTLSCVKNVNCVLVLWNVDCGPALMLSNGGFEPWTVD